MDQRQLVVAAVAVEEFAHLYHSLGGGCDKGKFTTGASLAATWSTGSSSSPTPLRIFYHGAC